MAKEAHARQVTLAGLAVLRKVLRSAAMQGAAMHTQQV
jgi:hypothetical protein